MVTPAARAAIACAGLALLAGCAKGVEGGGFDSFNTSVGSTSPSTTNSDDDESSGDDGITSSISADASASDTSAGESSSASTTAEGSGDGSTSGVDAGESTSGDPSTTGANTTNMSGGESSSDGGNPGGGQPDSGMYSHCTMPENMCANPAPVCVYTMTDGFCSNSTCMGNGDNCDDAPADSNADPICITAEDQLMNPVYLCALDCSGGETCPAGMVCTAVTFDMITNYNVCM